MLLKSNQISTAILTTSLVTALSKGGTLLRIMILAIFFGTEASLDAFYAVLACMGIAIFIIGDVFSSMWTTVLFENEDKYKNTFLIFPFVYSVIASILLYVFIEPLSYLLLNEEFKNNTSIDFQLIFLTLLPVSIFYCTYQSFIAYFRYKKMFVLSLMVEFVQTISILVFTVVFYYAFMRMDDAASYKSYVLGTSYSAGFMLALLWQLSVWIKVNRGHVKSSGNNISKHEFSNLVKKIGYLSLLPLTMYGTTIIDRYYASSAMVGGIAILTYAGTITFAVRSIINYEGVLLTEFLESQNQSKSLNKAIALTILTSMFVGVFMYWQAEKIADFFFFSSSIDASDKMHISDCIKAYGVCTPIFMLWGIFFRFFQAINKSNIILFPALTIVVINFYITGVLIKYLGISGVIYGTGVSFLVVTLILTFVAKKYAYIIEGKKICMLIVIAFLINNAYMILSSWIKIDNTLLHLTVVGCIYSTSVLLYFWVSILDVNVPLRNIIKSVMGKLRVIK